MAVNHAEVAQWDPISSLSGQANQLLGAVCSHWSVENELVQSMLRFLVLSTRYTKLTMSYRVGRRQGAIIYKLGIKSTCTSLAFKCKINSAYSTRNGQLFKL